MGKAGNAGPGHTTLATWQVSKPNLEPRFLISDATFPIGTLCNSPSFEHISPYHIISFKEPIWAWRNLFISLFCLQITLINFLIWFQHLCFPVSVPLFQITAHKQRDKFMPKGKAIQSVVCIWTLWGYWLWTLDIVLTFIKQSSEVIIKSPFKSGTYIHEAVCMSV